MESMESEAKIDEFSMDGAQSQKKSEDVLINN
jgi:hypothetical protein